VLASGLTAHALAALDDYDRRYAEHRFAPEALYWRMEALARSARAVEARTIAKRLATMYPNSPQSTRARVVLSEAIPRSNSRRAGMVAVEDAGPADIEDP
jgi:TolA-binding protein